jgi:hypothetical protein
MPVKIAAPLFTVFTLDECDSKYALEGPPSTVTVKQARESEHIIRQGYFAKLEQRWSGVHPQEVTVVQNLGLEELARLECRLTVIDCNLEDENGKKIFNASTEPGANKLAMSTQQFEEAWGKLPLDVANEIHEKVLEMNPQWAGSSGEAS